VGLLSCNAYAGQLKKKSHAKLWLRSTPDLSVPVATVNWWYNLRKRLQANYHNNEIAIKIKEKKKKTRVHTMTDRYFWAFRGINDLSIQSLVPLDWLKILQIITSCKAYQRITKYLPRQRLTARLPYIVR